MVTVNEAWFDRNKPPIDHNSQTKDAERLWQLERDLIKAKTYFRKHDVIRYQAEITSIKQKWQKMGHPIKAKEPRSRYRPVNNPDAYARQVRESFRHFAEARRMIVMLDVDAASEQMLSEYCHTQGFDTSQSYSGKPIKKFGFHMTLFVSENHVLFKEQEVDIEPFVLQPVGFEVLGTSTPTLRFAFNEKPYTLRYKLLETYGVHPTFQNFKPHVSLSYNWTGTPDLNFIVLPCPVTFSRMKIKEFKS